MVGAARPAHRARVAGPGPRPVPASARRLALPLYRRSQERMAVRWGFDLNAPDAPERAEAALAEQPGDADRLVLVAAVRSSRGDDDAALDAARQAVAADPTSARAHTTLATLLGRGGDREGAAAEAGRAVELDPGDPAALYNRGLMLHDRGDRRGAAADFRRAGDILGVEVSAWWQRLRRPG